MHHFRYCVFQFFTIATGWNKVVDALGIEYFFWLYTYLIDSHCDMLIIHGIFPTKFILCVLNLFLCLKLSCVCLLEFEILVKAIVWPPLKFLKSLFPQFIMLSKSFTVILLLRCFQDMVLRITQKAISAKGWCRLWKKCQARHLKSFRLIWINLEWWFSLDNKPHTTPSRVHGQRPRRLH